MSDEELWNYQKLDRLGQLIADGEADEPGGEWIRREYRQTCRILGIIKITRKRKVSSVKINEFMAERIRNEKCGKCNGELKQSRSGSFVAVCVNCKARYRLGRVSS